MTTQRASSLQVQQLPSQHAIVKRGTLTALIVRFSHITTQFRDMARPAGAMLTHANLIAMQPALRLS